jgi:hypothetical protein
VKQLVVITVFFTALAHIPANAQEDKKPDKPSKDERLDRETPEGTLRIFSIGVMLTNEKLVKMTALKVSEKDMKYLLKPTKNLRTTPKETKEFWASRKVKVLKAGDKFNLPGNNEIVIGKDEVTDDRMVVVLEDSPIPTRLYKIEGHWWVDPAPLIASRKAAEKAKLERELAAEKEKKKEKTAPSKE